MSQHAIPLWNLDAKYPVIAYTARDMNLKLMAYIANEGKHVKVELQGRDRTGAKVRISAGALTERLALKRLEIFLAQVQQVGTVEVDGQADPED